VGLLIEFVISSATFVPILFNLSGSSSLGKSIVPIAQKPDRPGSILSYHFFSFEYVFPFYEDYDTRSSLLLAIFNADGTLGNKYG
jgi:hypothetical protein